MASEHIAMNVQLWRQKAREGTLTLEETRAAIAAIRKERIGASAVSAASTEKKSAAKEKAKPINSDDLLSELGL
jgi:hypothetical protein